MSMGERERQHQATRSKDLKDYKVRQFLTSLGAFVMGCRPLKSGLAGREWRLILGSVRAIEAVKTFKWVTIVTSRRGLLLPRCAFL
jgi:hypothetical protein